ncbi:MAG: cysteine synthase B [Acidimicrobiaceae bacterium TMED130]|nr:MAG: cysteine synthase B [Acidimicrobiaceae bacterium TMED130]|tara:strand:- start:42282 stop:43232 length:951 start_codon:yes stop_codon:yes gene_type:complete
MVAHSSILDLIGNTPVVDVSKLSPNPNVKIFAKLENQNPAGSVKDRIAKSMVLQAEEDGLLKPGSTLIEPSSGNTGIALAMIASMRNYNLKIVLPENVSIERKQLLEVWGAEIIPSPGELGSNGAVKLAQEISEKNPDWVFLYQYGNESNPQVHYETTGPEILADVPGITHFVAGLGTSGTLMGVGKFLRENKEDVEILAVEPPSGEAVQGLRSLEDGFIPPVFENWKGLEILNGKRIVRPKESIHHTRLLASECGIFSGISSGAALAGARRVSEKIESGEIVFIVCDGGWKYLSTGAWSGDLEDVAKSIDSIIYF